VSAQRGRPALDDAHLATLGRLTRGALHEFANPLLALLGSTELALAEAGAGTKLHGRLAVIERTALELSEIVCSLQAYIREQDAPVGSVSVADSAEAAVALVRRVSAVPDIELAVRADSTPVVDAAAGTVLRSLVELLLAGLASAERGDRLELVVGERDGEATALLVGTGEIQLGSVTG